jgi:hypothetical protein
MSSDHNPPAYTIYPAWHPTSNAQEAAIPSSMEIPHQSSRSSTRSVKVPSASSARSGERQRAKYWLEKRFHTPLCRKGKKSSSTQRSKSLSVYSIQTSFDTSRGTTSRRPMNFICIWNTAAAVTSAHTSSVCSGLTHMLTRYVHLVFCDHVYRRLMVL